MVSKLLSSLTDLLTGSEETPEKKSAPKKKSKKKSQTSKDRKPEINQNENISQTPSNTSVKSETKKSNIKIPPNPSTKADVEYLNAESLDRAIVNRLQSKVSFTTSTAAHERRTNAGESKRSNGNVGYSRENLQNRHLVDEDGNKASENRKLTREVVFPEVHASGSQTNTRSFTDLSDAKDTAQFKSFVEQMDSTTLFPTAVHVGDHRSVVYKNAQFSLENVSREALITDVTVKENTENETLLKNPLFGIRETSLYGQPTSSPSTEALRANRNTGSTESVLGNSTVHSFRNRSGSPSPGPSPFRASMFTPTFSGSSTNVGEQLFETTMNEIIEKGGDEFKNKYSSWVWEAFRSHLIQLKSLLLHEFNQKMRSTLEEREQDVMTLQQQYREKLAEFDVTTEGFQKMIDNLYQENQRVLKAKDFIIEKLKKEFMECKRHFEHDLIRQLQNYRKEAEVEKLELQKRNDELMMIMLTDATKSGLEEAFKREIESLHKMIKALTTQNEVLHQQLEEANSSASLNHRKAVENVQAQLEQTSKEIGDLRRRLQHAEREKEDLTVSHNEEIAKLNRRMQETATRYDHQIRDAAEEMDNIRKRYNKEIKELKQKLQTQETQHSQILNQVKQQYGGQVESLSKAVSQLQSELTMNGSRR